MNPTRDDQASLYAEKGLELIKRAWTESGLPIAALEKDVELMLRWGRSRLVGWSSPFGGHPAYAPR